VLNQQYSLFGFLKAFFVVFFYWNFVFVVVVCWANFIGLGRSNIIFEAHK
jgi:hypothetical protein